MWQVSLPPANDDSTCGRVDKASPETKAQVRDLIWVAERAARGHLGAQSAALDGCRDGSRRPLRQVAAAPPGPAATAARPAQEGPSALPPPGRGSSRGDHRARWQHWVSGRHILEGRRRARGRDAWNQVTIPAGTSTGFPRSTYRSPTMPGIWIVTSRPTTGNAGRGADAFASGG